MAGNCGINEEISRGRAFWMPQIPISLSLDDLISMERKALCPQRALHKRPRCLKRFVQQYLVTLALSFSMHSAYLWVRTLISSVRFSHCEDTR